MAKNYFERIRPFAGKLYAYDVDLEISEKTLDKLSDGIPIVTNENIKVRLQSQSKPVPDFLGNTYKPVVSEKIKNILLDLNDKDFYQFIPCEIDNRKKNYWVLNIKQNIECFDWNNSKYRTYSSNPNVIAEINIISMNVEKIGPRNLFRMSEFNIPLFISDYLIEIFEEEKVTGYKVSNTNDFIYP